MLHPKPFSNQHTPHELLDPAMFFKKNYYFWVVSLELFKFSTWKFQLILPSAFF